ncbi:methylated-DNA-[protein]-cysteine S-methyltransferase family protein [Myxococcus stipitatus DSM 14675]|uniref:Methylated-DNA-[protein]-cysteine S-methyltransferase family protein n=1 Tax=Myxococcus stipitatus (strain DSM 14675 / JCM 12634 / Mx s8) TaxID=1278073 RepID=L7UHF7_MYXSD|nr:methylated-DNA-[protein]-cysteine S-methyltransferase family protein [Myxococcus stipitatus DSM 14675]
MALLRRPKTKPRVKQVESAPAKRPPFSEAVWRAVRAIPRGQVRSYSQVALYAGRPGAARGVGREMTTLPSGQEVPWWRVTKAGGVLASTVAHEQAKRLRAEGVEVEQRGQVFRVKRAPEPSERGQAAVPARKTAAAKGKRSRGG